MTTTHVLPSEETRLRAFRAATLPLLAAALVGCRALDATAAPEPPPDPPVPGAVLVDELILPEEVHFKHLWQVTFGGQNAEAYWSFAGDRLSLQVTDPSQGVACDRIYVTSPGGGLSQVSNGRGVTTCSFFMPGDEEVLYASTQAAHVGCPKKPASEGYTWMVWPDYDIYVASLVDGTERKLVGGYGYDAEATVSPRQDRIVFTSTRSGDLELWTCDLEGGDLVQVTDTLGYDGGAFFSHDGERLVFRATEWEHGNEAEDQEQYRDDLALWRVRPSRMEIYTIGVDGTDRTQVTALGGANFAPYYFPDDSRILFSTNHHNEGPGPKLNFDLFAVDADGRNLERITYFDGPPGRQFDSFPMFSPDGRYLAFSSNRGEGEVFETNVFVAEWQP